MNFEFVFLQTKHIFTSFLFEQHCVFYRAGVCFSSSRRAPSPPSDHYNKKSGRLRAENWELIGKYIITPSPQEEEEAGQET